MRFWKFRLVFHPYCCGQIFQTWNKSRQEQINEWREELSSRPDCESGVKLAELRQTYDADMYTLEDTLCNRDMSFARF